MPDLPKVIELAIPVYVLAILLEVLFGLKTGRRTHELRDTLSSITVAVMLLVVATFMAFIGVESLAYIQRNHGLIDWGWSWWVFVLCFVADDLRKYWVHRIQHRCRWFWAAHVTHHSSQHYNFATALRNPPTVLFTQTFVFRIPLMVVGFPMEMVAFVAGLNSIYQFFTHTEMIHRMPWWYELVLVSPAHHRVHHASNPRYLDANYSPVFIVWDRMFGTFIDESDEEPVRYGLVKNLGSLNPVRVALHEWVAMVGDVLQPGIGLGQRLGYLLGPPGWSHDGSRETTAMIRARHAAAADARAD